MWLAPDPDIPADRQRLLFQSSEFRAGWRWSLNGAELPDVITSGWRPERPGQYLLVLKDENGVPRDQVHFWVRGGSAEKQLNGDSGLESAQD
jgi:hypothetical protein